MKVMQVAIDVTKTPGRYRWQTRCPLALAFHSAHQAGWHFRGPIALMDSKGNPHHLLRGSPKCLDHLFGQQRKDWLAQ